MVDCVLLRKRLAEAQNALHLLLTGRKVVSVRYGEKQTQYDAANIAALRAYIADLQHQVDACDGVTTNHRHVVQFIPN